MNALLHLIYPALCIHCKELLLEPQKILCGACLSLLTLIDPEERCRQCFTESSTKICKECQKRGLMTSKFALCFDHFGPVVALMHAFERRLYLDRPLASWMVVQMERMKFPFPDLIFPFPQTFSHRILNGYNRASLLAGELGRFYQTCVKKNLRCTSDHRFYWKKPVNISDQTILLVLEKTPPIKHLSDCIELIQSGFPKSVGVIACV
jgi:predicted amidophosphoribosyltransferase